MVLSSKEMAVIDRNAQYFDKSEMDLMEKAGKKVAEEIEFGESASVFCGEGNNGGDGFVVARYLKEKGYEVFVYLVGDSSSLRTEAAKKNFEELKKLDVTIFEEKDPGFYDNLEISSDVVVDAILGLGIKGKPREPQKSAIKAINNSTAKKISVDIPSGINPDTGEGKGIKPDKTITFHEKKKGNKNAKTVEIGIPQKAKTHAGPGHLYYLNQRKKTSHKGENGTILILGGGEFTGAPAISAMSALRSGVDLPIIHTKNKVKDIIAGFSPNLIVKSHKNYKKAQKNLKNNIKKFDSVLIGPGIGREKKDINALIKLIPKINKPTILDADALHAATKDIDMINNKIITPHESEFKKLFNKKGTKENVKKMAKKHSCIIVKKSNIDIISNGQKTKLNESGTPAMTVGGTGDALAGAIAANVAKNKNNLFETTVATTFLIGKAGELAEKEYGNGLTATDLIEKIPKAKEKLND
ncbi:bifunctional ADP-dependent NAD(P)H-hydrate dehydratase/NAD(P)H-hydrate epimerase [archaeon SCG-AAA382B04]|nr:bifunctional ADP-dependent NAD(P)H-hydrate dehydratase/NAD(P)H-hydrate epimerase [archaeon SCG-AAA382B04]